MNTFKSIFLFTGLFFIFGLMSCADLLIKEKDVFQKKISLFAYYDGVGSPLITNSGLIVQIQKSLTNGDSVKCEVFSSTENIFTKVDFSGKILWEKTIKDFALYNSVQDNNGNFYQLMNTFPAKIKMYDSLLNFKNEKILDLKTVTKYNAFLDHVIYWKDDKFIGYGTMPMDKKSKGEIVYKEYFCVLSLKNGIETFVEGNEELVGPQVSSYGVEPNGNLTGFYKPNKYVQNETKLYLRKYSNAFKVTQKKDTTINMSLNFNNNNQKFNNGNLYSLIYGDGSIANPNKVLKIDNKLKLSFLDFTNSNRFEFLMNNADKILISRYENNKTAIYELNENFKTEKLTEIVNNYDQLLVNFNNLNKIQIYSFAQNFNNRKSKIEFKTYDDTDKTIIKELYQSQYTRNCNRFFD